MSIRNLYQFEDHFYLIYDKIYTEISEPVNWDKVDITIDRDPDFYGVNYEFVKGDVQLLFPYSAGGDMVVDYAKTIGSDALLYFEYGYTTAGVYEKKYTGVVNLNTWTRDKTGVTANIEKTVFESTFRTRYDTTITVNSRLSLLDQSIITPLAPISITLHSKKITRKGVGGNEEGKLDDGMDYSDYSTNNLNYIQPNTENISVSELEGLQAMSFGFTHNEPWGDSLFQFKAIEDGALSVTVKMSGKLFLTQQRPTGSFPGYLHECRAKMYIMQRRAGVDTYNYGPEVTYSNGSAITGILNGVFSDSLSETLSVLIDDEIYVGVFLYVTVAGTTGYNTRYSGWSSLVTLSQETTAPSSACSCYNIFKLLNYAMWTITGVQNSVRSSFFGPGGKANRYAVTNGYALRNFKVTEYPLQISLQDLLESLAAIWNIGIGFKQEEGVDVVVIEPMDNFFSGTEIARFAEVSEYTESHAKDWVYNQFEIGYEKFPTDDLNTLDEFNTLHNYLLPITTYSKKLSKKSKLIASGYAIEQQRREQYKKDPSSSLSYDDDPFIIGYTIGLTSRKNEDFEILSGVLSPDTVYNAEISPKHMFYNWSSLLNIGIYLKPDSAIIKNTFAKNNGNMVSKLLSGVATTDKQHYVMIEDGDVRLSNYNDRVAPFMPIIAKFKAPVSWETILLIKMALSGELGDGRDYGYIVVYDDKGMPWEAHVTSLTYSPLSEMAQIESLLIKKV